MVVGLAPNFEFDSFLSILFRADVLHSSLCMCSFQESMFLVKRRLPTGGSAGGPQRFDQMNLHRTTSGSRPRK